MFNVVSGLAKIIFIRTNTLLLTVLIEGKTRFLRYLSNVTSRNTDSS